MTTNTTKGRFDRLDLASILLVVGSAALNAALWSSLPDRIPTHFDLWGAVDDDMRRSIGAWVLPGSALVLLAVVRLLPLRMPEDWQERAAGSPMSAVGVLMTGLLTGLHVVCLWAALHPGESAARPLGVCLAVFWLAFSLLVPRVRRNTLVGIRTRWSLSSDENWARTHRFAGLVGAVAGVVALVGGISGTFPLVVAAIVLGALIPTVYSYWLARRLPPTA
jgi:uncharacterized membrane protein